MSPLHRKDDMENEGTKVGRVRGILRNTAGAVLTILGTVAGGILIYLGIAWFGLKPIVRMELGDILPEAGSFGRTAEAYIEPPETDTTGIHSVRLQLAGGKERRAWLWIRDTKAPEAIAVERTISTKTILQPTELIDRLTDADKVRVSFSEQPPFGTAGDYRIVIYLEDVSGNRSSVESLLHIRVTGEGLIREAGTKLPGIRSFLIDEYDVEHIDGLEEDVMSVPGVYPVTVTVDGEQYETTLTVIDTVPPVAETETVIAPPGSDLSPEEFLHSVTDATAVTAEFIHAPDPDLRDFQQVTIRLTDLGGNTTELTAGLLFSFARPVTVEARRTALQPEECLPDGSFGNAAFIQNFIPDHTGRYAVAMDVDGDREIAVVDVVDTTAPVIRAENMTWYVDHPLPAEDLIRELSDATDVLLTLDQEIDWTQSGTQDISLTAVDEGGNTGTAKLQLKLVRDTEPPKIYGVRNQICYVGEATAYLQEVFAEDSVDGQTEVNVDTSKVDRNRPGNYTVTYVSSDRSGNIASVSCVFRFVQATVTEEELRAKAASIVSRITNPEMTRTEVLVAVYDYVYNNVRYTGTSDKNDWRKEAMRGFNRGTGDCFTFYATLRALLDETDIPYMSVTRKGGYTRHFWLIVNVGTGWYHLDANHNGTAHWKCFMWTNKQVSYPPVFWNYEHSIYPEIATEPFVAEDVIAAEKRQKQGT